MLVRCIRKMREGGQWLERAAMARAMDVLLRRGEGEREVAKLLAQREIEIVRCVAQGLRNKEIANRLEIKEGSVKIHRHDVYEARRRRTPGTERVSARPGAGLAQRRRGPGLLWGR